MSEFSVFFGTVLTVNGEKIRIDNDIPLISGDGYADILISYIDDMGNECGATLFSPYEIFTLAAKAEKIVYPNGDIFIRE